MMKRNGFTLIELLVTIAVIAVLVLLAAPRLLGYTDKAKISELTVNTREIQSAAERYYLDHDEAEWPRLTDEPYTDVEVKAFAEKIYDITGEEVELDENGKYYDIDFDKLKPYIDVPGDKTNYILQNPVGKVHALYKQTEKGTKRFQDPVLETYTANSTFIAPYSGTYKFELSGGRGGGSGQYGGYVSGEIYLEKEQELKIIIGKEGGAGKTSRSGLYREKGGSGGGGSSAILMNSIVIAEAKGGTGASGYKDSYNGNIGMNLVGSGGYGYSRGKNGGGSLPTNNRGGAGGGSNRVSSEVTLLENIASYSQPSQIIIMNVE